MSCVIPVMENLIKQELSDVRLWNEDNVFRAVINVGIQVDKDRLSQALTDARAFYEEGYRAAMGRSEWISVKERLPKDERSVLAYYGFGRDGVPNSDMMFTGVLSYFCFDPEPHWQHASHNVVVTHWMPLPEPPKEG